MSDYTDAAPKLSLFVDETTFMEDFPEPDPPPVDPPDPNTAKWLAVYEDYVSEYQANGGAVGLTSLAQRHGIKRRHVVLLDAEVRAAIAALYSGD